MKSSVTMEKALSLGFTLPLKMVERNKPMEVKLPQPLILYCDNSKELSVYAELLKDCSIEPVEANNHESLEASLKKFIRPLVIYIQSASKESFPDFLKEFDVIYLENSKSGVQESERLRLLHKPVKKKTLLTTICPQEKREPQTETKANNNFSLNILLVEDNRTNQKLAKMLLKKLGCEITLAEDGLIALEVLKENRVFDVILMDCQMPNMDGYECTKEIRKSEKLKDSVIIAMTANAMQGDKEKCLNAGMNDYMTKTHKQEAYHRRFESIRQLIF